MNLHRPHWLIFSALLGVVAAAFGTTRERIYHPPDDAVSIPTGADAIARGKHLVEAIAVCTICHGDDLGGKLAFDDPFLGHGYTANLTRGRGGVGQYYSERDWIRAIRYGVRPDGHGIAFMPSDHYNAITDTDLGAIIAYVQSLPPINNERTSVELNPLARILIATGLFGQVNRTARIDFSTPRPAMLPDSGAYIVAVGGCTFCHGPGLSGGQGPEPGAPAAPSLTLTGPFPNRTKTEFVTAMRNGLGADGHVINTKFMPWLGYRNMTDAELWAIWRFTGRRS